MNARAVLWLLLVFSAGRASAQEPACHLFKVTAALLNISSEAGGQSVP